MASRWPPMAAWLLDNHWGLVSRTFPGPGCVLAFGYTEMPNILNLNQLHGFWLVATRRILIHIKFTRVSVLLKENLDSWESLGLQGDPPVHSDRDQPWDFFGRNDAKAETPVLWPPHAKNWLIGKDSDAGRDWGQEEKGTTEDEMAGWHRWLDGRESGWTPGVGDGQGGLACCNSWGRKESDMTEWLNWTELKGHWNFFLSLERQSNQIPFSKTWFITLAFWFKRHLEDHLKNRDF